MPTYKVQQILEDTIEAKSKDEALNKFYDRIAGKSMNDYTDEDYTTKIKKVKS
jgi:hypothetical protein